MQEYRKTLKADGAIVTDHPGVVNFEDIIMKINERNPRKKNIIIFGIQEPDQTERSQICLQKDKVAFNQVVKAIDPYLGIGGDVTPIRLGFFNNENIRPIRFTLHRETQIMSIVRKSKKLNSSSFKNVRV